MTIRPGTLYVVATPIGNLDDLSARARDVLSNAGLVAAEDTRRAGQLLTHLGLRKRLISLHEHNEKARVDQIVAEVRDGTDVALISDAGTPLISDPGYQLLAEMRVARMPVVPVPGCSAVIAALSVAGLPTDKFRFEGFLPARTKGRRQRLEQLRDCPDTIVCFESVHRIDASLADVCAVLGQDRPITAARELTKLHESLYRGTAADVRQEIADDPGGGKGEYTLVIGSGSAAADPQVADLERIIGILVTELGPSQAAQLAARITGVRRADAYALAQRLRSPRA